MTCGGEPGEATDADGLDVPEALARAAVAGLPLDAVTRPGVTASLVLLAEHYRAVRKGLAAAGAAGS